MPADRDEKVKRPPNPWILFRSDCARMFADEEARNPERPKKTQAQISKEISQLWANLDPNVKAQYEARAEAKKQEHNMKHPSYRFQPVKKEEKERIKAEKKANEKEERRRLRDQESAAQYQASSLSLQVSSTAQVSSSSAPSSLPFPIQNYASSSTTVPVPTNTPVPSSSTSPTPALVPPPPSRLYSPTAAQGRNPYGPSPPMFAVDSPYSINQDLAGDELANTLHIPPPLDLSAGLDGIPANDLAVASEESANTWTSASPEAAPEVPWNSGELAPTGQWADGYGQQENFLQLNIAEPLPSWGPDAAAQFDQNLQAIINSSGNPSIFTLDNIDPDALNVGAPLDLSLGNINIDLSMFSEADWANLAPYMPVENDFFGTPPAPPTPDALSTQYTESSPPPPSFIPAPPYTEYEDNMSQYLNLDGGSSRQSSQASYPMQLPSPSSVSDASEFSASASISSYAPAGLDAAPTPGPAAGSSFAPPAAYSGQRRAGGMWKVPVGLSDAVVQPWKVRA